MTSQNPQIILEDPSDLTIHPLAKPMPEWANDDECFLSLVDDIRLRGIDQPILVDLERRVIDGRHRLRAAKRLQLKLVPTIVSEKFNVASLIVNSLIQRRHYSKGARAYLAFPLLEPAMEEARQRKLANLRHNTAEPVVTGESKTVADLAASIGVGRDLFFQAKTCHETFEKHPELKEQFEPQILSGEMGLGAAIAGMAGQAATKNKPKAKALGGQLQLFTETFTQLRKRYHYWDKFDDDQKASATRSLQQNLGAMPDDLLKATYKALTKEIKTRKKQASEN